MNARIAGFLLIVFLPFAAAQTHRGVIAGDVSTSASQPVAGAKITLTSADTGRTRATTSDPRGNFAFAALDPAEYSLVVEHAGFAKLTRAVDLRVNQELRIEAVLSESTRTDTVNVTAARDVLKTESASLSTLIDPSQIRALPLDGRNYLDLALLSAGSAPAAQGSAGSARGDLALHFNGAREDQNNFLLDGVYNGDGKLNTFGSNPPVDGIREFEVLTSSYDASFGRNGGGQINVVTRAGGNQVHGAAWEFFRNASLDARNYFAPASEPKPKYQRNQFGGALGGPIVRDRSFFFLDYEGRRNREGITRVTNVPTALERAGDFSQSRVPAIDLFTFQPFAGNKIPAQRLHPIGQAIAGLYPLPNRATPGANFVSSPTLRDRDDRFDVRLDHALSARTELTGRYSFNDRDLFDPFSGAGFARVPGYGTNIPRRSQNAMLAATHTFAPTLVNETRLAFNRVALQSLHQNQGRSINRTVGLPDLQTRDRDLGLTYISIAGFSPLGDEYNNPQRGVINTYQVNDQASWTRGTHLIKFGFDHRVTQQNAFRDVQSRGLINFIGFTGNALAEMLQGFPTVTGGSFTLDNPQHLRTKSTSFFAQDSWRAGSGLTVTLGLRYEYNSPAVDATDRASLYDASTGRIAAVGTGSLPRAGYTADRNNFAPRAGFAWSPGRGPMVVRGGYGIYYDQSALAPGEGLYFSAPYYDFRLFITSAQFPLLLHDPFPIKTYPYPSPASALAFQRDLRTAYIQHWNFSIGRSLGGSRVVEIAYAGSKGTKLIGGRDINQPRPSTAQPNYRPNPQFDDINRIESRGSSNYHSLQTRFEQRVARGIAVIASHTWSKSIDDASAFFPSAGDTSYPQDSYNVRAERGRSSFDVAQRVAAAYTVDLPLGFQTSGILTLQTGRPFTVALLSDIDNSNTGRSILAGANDRPNLIGNAALASPGPDRWFNTSAFAPSAFGTFGNAGRNILEGPGLAVWSTSLVKNLKLGDALSAQIRAEAFNALNRPNFDLPDNQLGSPSFGRVLSAGAPRRIQFGLKFLF